MSEPRLKTRFQVGAAVRLGAQMGIAVTVARRGEPDGGAIAIKLNQGAGRFAVLTQIRDLEGRLSWMRTTGPEPVAEPLCDAYLEKAAKRDPDLWVVEIEDREGRHLFEGQVI